MTLPCTACKRDDLPVDRFHRDANAKARGGFRYRCKACAKADNMRNQQTYNSAEQQRARRAEKRA